MSHVGASAAPPAAERCGSDAGEFHCVEAARQIGGDANDDRRLPLGTGHNGDDARTNAPLQVIGRLVLLSILVGVILAAIGLDPWNIIESIQRLLQHLWNLGFDTVRWLWRYFLLGAVIVVPLWLLTRVAKVPRNF